MQTFLFEDAVSRDFEIVAILSDENLSSELEVIAPKNLPNFSYELVDGIILTNPSGSLVKYFIKQGVAPRKIILWDAKEGWGNFNLPDSDGTQIIYFCGLEFHIRNDSDAKFFYQTHYRLQRQWQVKNLRTGVHKG